MTQLENEAEHSDSGNPGEQRWISSSTYWTIAALLGAAAVLSAFLVSKHFGGGLPGCGPTSGCEALEKTPWGKIPGIGWPVSFIGLAYFFALLVGWMSTDRNLPFPARWLFRAGGVGSLLLIGVMLAYRRFCPYCAGIHAANLTILIMIEQASMRAARQSLSPPGPTAWKLIGKAAASSIVAFSVVSLAMGIADARFQEKVRAGAEGDRRESTDQILAQSRIQSSSRSSSPQTQAQPFQPDTPGMADGVAGRSGFTGRYLLGPEASPIRIVMLTDYQCDDCKMIETELEEILATRHDVSLSIKQFPMCQEASPGVPCNRFATRTLHSNACWAARAAEAAGILKGNQGFWDMHRWLFARGGEFDNEELLAAVSQMGYDPEEFKSVMQGAETLRRVQADCEEGNSLGLYFTPMIFVNGVEFKGWQVSGGLRQTIEEVAATNPPPLDATADRPPLAEMKDIQDWRDQPARTMPPAPRSWPAGASSASAVPQGSRLVDVVLFGDYQEPYTVSVDASIREVLKSMPNVRYTFRHFPIDPTTNPTVPQNVRPEAIHPLAGRAAQAAVAAGSLRGAAGFWTMHDWLMANLKTFDDVSLRAAAQKMGIDPHALFAEMEKPEIAAAIAEDARAAKQLGLTAVPMLFVNGKWVWRTSREGESIAAHIIQEAGRQ